MKRTQKPTATDVARRLLERLAMFAGMILMLCFLTPLTSTTLVVDEVLAAGPPAQHGSGAMAGGQGGKGGKSDHATGQRGGAKGVKGSILAEEGDEDSDRPAWYGGNTDANPHMPADKGGGKPDTAGDMKGDDYGDLIVLVRDPETGIPMVEDEEGNLVKCLDADCALELLVCLDAGCTDYVAMIDGEIPEGVTAIEVDFGRASVARSPASVTDKALTDALAKLTTADSISTDTAGRISYTIDGVTSTIDSPLENLALYIDLVTGLADDEVTSQAEAALGELATLETAASLFAGVGDKTGDISIDYVVYQNVNADVVESGEYYDYSGFVYFRDYPTDYSYFYMDGDEVKSATLNINDYLAAINGDLPTGSTALFAAAADDAVEVIELLHTQIHEAIIVLP